MLEYKILLKSLFVLNCVFIFCLRKHQHCLDGDSEDGHHRWSQHVGGNADYDIINLHNCICNIWLFLIRKHQFIVMNNLKSSG
jgi:hypothetical protein